MSERTMRRALTAQALLLQAAFVGLRISVVYSAIETGADAAFLGILAASFAAPAIVFGIPLGGLAGRIGGAQVSWYGMLLMVVGSIGMIGVPGLAALLLFSMAAGLGLLASMIGEQAIIAQRQSSRSIDSEYGTLALAASLGQLVGPPAIAWAMSAGPNLETAWSASTFGIAMAGACALLAMPTHLVLRKVRVAGRRSGVGPASTARVLSDRRSVRILRTPGVWQSLVASGAVVVTVDLSYAFIPAWATERGIAVTTVGWLLAIRAGVSVLSRIGLGTLVRRFGRKTLLISGMSVGAASLCALPFVDVIGAAFVMVGLGLALGLPQPLTLAWMVDIARVNDRAAAVGLRMTINRVGQFFIPVGLGLVAAPLGIGGVFWANALILAAAAALVGRSDPDAGRVQPPT